MRTSLNKIKAIDDFLLGNMAPGDALVYEANLLLNSDLREDLNHQRNTYAIIRQYSRQKIKAELVAVQELLASAPQHRGFMHRLVHLFKNQ